MVKHVLSSKLVDNLNVFFIISIGRADFFKIKFGNEKVENNLIYSLGTTILDNSCIIIINYSWVHAKLKYRGSRP